MKLGLIVGNVVSTFQHSTLDGRPLLLARFTNLAGEAEGPEHLVVDTVGAGPGQWVLILDEGSSARQILASPEAPVRAVVVGIVDAVDLPT